MENYLISVLSFWFSPSSNKIRCNCLKYKENGWKMFEWNENGSEMLEKLVLVRLEILNKKNWFSFFRISKKSSMLKFFSKRKRFLTHFSLFFEFFKKKVLSKNKSNFWRSFLNLSKQICQNTSIFGFEKKFST